MQMVGSVIIENFNLPQFSRKQNITTSFHMYHKKAEDRYDIIISHDLLADLGLDLHYSTSQFVWNEITVDMVPSGYWTQEKISNLAKTWNSKRKLTRKIDPKIKSAAEENAKKISAWNVETETRQKSHLDQNITDQPTEDILTLQETDAEDTPDNHLLQTLMTKQSNYTDQTKEQKVKCMPVNQTANLDGIKTAVEALPVQPYKMSQKCMLAASHNNILINPDANEHGSMKTLANGLNTITQIHQNEAVPTNHGNPFKMINIHRINPHHIQE
jgi:hypothetical protein